MKASASPYRDIGSIPTGLPNIDKILGVGGIPFRRITEISGPYSVGKTTLALMVVAQAQKMGLRCLWSDLEWSFDENYAVALGVDIDTLDLVQQRFSEDALDEIEAGLEAKEYDLVVLDSVGGILPRQEAEKEAGGKVIGGQAKLVAVFCRKVVPLLAMNNIALIALNHEFVDLMHGNLKTSGGMKLEYHKSIWLRLQKLGKVIKQGENAIGEVIKATIRKNKLANTVKQETQLTMLFGAGFSAEADLLQNMLDSGEVVRKGNSYFRGETKIGGSLSAARESLKELA